MPTDWHDINEPGFYLRPTPEGEKQPPGEGDNDSADRSTVQTKPEIRFITAQFEPHPVHGYAINKPCFVTGTAEFLQNTSMTKCSLQLLIIYDNQEQDLHIHPDREGTAYIDKKTGEFRFENVNLWIIEEYPDRDAFKTPVRYKGVVSSRRCEKPLEFFIELPANNAAPPILKRGMYDDKGVQNYPSKCVKDADGYVEGTPVHEFQRIMERFHYLPRGGADGVFGPNTEKAAKQFQSDSLEPPRVKESGGKLTQAHRITFSDTVDGIVGPKTREEIAVWQREGYLRPLPNLYYDDYDREAVKRGLKSNRRGGEKGADAQRKADNDDYHDTGTPVLKAQQALQKIDAYDGALDGWFSDKMRDAVKLFQSCAEKGEFLINGVVADIGERLTGHRKGVLDIPTQELVPKVVEVEGKVPRQRPYGGYELKLDDNDKEKRWGGETREDDGAFVKELQEDLSATGFTEVGAADGDFGDKTLSAVSTFQLAAQKQNRKKDGRTVQAEVSYRESDEGVVDDSTASEIKLWLAKRYSKPEPEVLTFPGTNFKYQSTSMKLQKCICTLPNQLRTDFKSKIETVIREMHKLGFAFGVLDSAKAGYRTFAQQDSIPAKSTNAGPGESFHNYGLAVDLGVLNWVDEDGKGRNDFWLGQMDSIKKYRGFPAKVWAQRNRFAPGGVYDLSWEVIHLQGVEASSSGRSALVMALNGVAAASWKYRKAANKCYECSLGGVAGWTNIGTAKQMWARQALNCTSAQQKTIREHMDEAESVALTMAL